MISPGLLQGASRLQGLVPDEDLVQSPLLAGIMQQQQQTSTADLPVLQAAREQAATQGQNLENEKLAAFLPVYKAALARSQGDGQPPQQNLPPTIPTNKNTPSPIGIPAGMSQQQDSSQDKPLSAYDQLTQLNQAKMAEDAQNKRNEAMGIPSYSNDANVALNGAILKTTKSASDAFKNEVTPSSANSKNPITWEQAIAALPPGKTNLAQNLFNDYKDAHPEITQLPKDQLDEISKSFVAPAQPNYATVLTQGSGTDGQVNPVLASKLAPGIIGESKNDAATYAKTKGFLSQAEDTYADYLKNPDDPGVRANMSAILDKFVGVSIQKQPTQAQIELAQAFPGLKNIAPKIIGWLSTGNPIAPDVLGKMMTVMRTEASGLGDQLITQNNTRGTQLKKVGLDESFLNTPNSTVQADQAKWKASNDNSATASLSESDQALIKKYSGKK